MEPTEHKADLRIVESASEWIPKYNNLISVAFVALLLISNILASKLFQIGSASFTAGILVFPLSYILGDVLTEVYGFNRARRIIYYGFVANIFMAIILWVAIKLPPAPGWPLQKEFEAIHSLVPRIVLASVIGYLLGELTNSFVMSRLKILTKARFLWVRTISSTVAGQFVDTSLFAFIAFGGIFKINLLIIIVLWGWIFKVAYEATATPFTYLVINRLKKLEGIEHFDKKDKLKLI